MNAVLREVPAGLIHINEREFSARLGQPSGDLPPGMRQECEEMVLSVVNYRYCYRGTQIARPGDNMLDLGFGEFRSRDLTRNLEGCQSAVLFAVTIGPGIDRLMQKLEITSEVRRFVVDAMGSALAEALCEQADAELSALISEETGCVCAPRFSPGYGDVPLSVQPGFADYVSAGKLMGIAVSETYIMQPSKSITAIMGIRDSERERINVRTI